MSHKNSQKSQADENHRQGMSRRNFLGLTGIVAVGLAASGIKPPEMSSAETLKEQPKDVTNYETCGAGIVANGLRLPRASGETLVTPDIKMGGMIAPSRAEHDRLVSKISRPYERKGNLAIAETLVVPESVSWRAFSPELPTDQIGGTCGQVATEECIRGIALQATDNRWWKLGCANQPAYNKTIDGGNFNPNFSSFFNNGEDGSTMYGLMGILQEHGICTNWPVYNYKDGYIAWNTIKPVSEEQIQEGLRFRPTRTEYLAGSYENTAVEILSIMKTALVNGPIISAFNIDQSLFPTNDLVPEDFNCPTRISTDLYHATVVVGYDNKHLNNEGDFGAFLVRPFGPKYTLDGFMWMPFSAIYYWKNTAPFPYFATVRPVYEDKNVFGPVDQQVPTPTTKPALKHNKTYLPYVGR